MTKEELEVVHETINEEGFDYTFLYLEDFADIEDPVFHLLREQYIQASKTLYNYLQMDSTEFGEPGPPETIFKSW